MTDHASFLAAVVAAPDDDLPRLVYADWLDERGDQDRAELIRLQVELAKIGPPRPKHEAVVRPLGGGQFVVDLTDDPPAVLPEPGCRIDVDAGGKLLRGLLVRRRIANDESPNYDDSGDRFLCVRDDRRPPSQKVERRMREREEELLGPNSIPWLPVCCAYLYLRDDTSEPPNTPLPLWTYTRGFVSQLVSTWGKWHRNSGAILAACPIRNAKDGLVRLTTWPEVEWDQRSLRTYRVSLAGHTVTITDDELARAGTDEAILALETRATLQLLAEAWRGVHFELPPASRFAEGVADMNQEVARGLANAFAEVGGALRRTTPRHRDDV